MKRRPLYIETKIKCDFDTLWTNTQEPSIHQQWDLRFTEIEYLPKNDPTDPQKFLYSTKVGFGIKVDGIGESVATKTKDNGESTSVLKFSSDSKFSLIKQGSGYWKYVPKSGGIKFFTGYDYETRWGLFGKLIDKFTFRPLMIWATAWSFDCLKNWIEKGLHPKQALNAQISVLLVNLTLGIIWIYQGLIPKILFTDTGEIEILRQSGLFNGNEENILTIIGIAEIAFGVALIFIHRKVLQYLNILGLCILTVGAIFSDLMIFTFPFNPFSLNISMIALSIIAILNFRFLPKASNCITKQK
ncbi:DoxX-like family protein [Belliella kenyensis]|uniref:DoxX-like family protein n=1 Tax=Belliella kenyensis TaxID=1472724 RepID=A0ABV8EN23_9BACT|nr:DoxX-like family protein [Belliella kenyensis]MCH7403507.1 DoxX-like family protein [Belliella kenyensis]MDN3604971.1 DoxX-like family protein [Belliella kenyensis]